MLVPRSAQMLCGASGGAYSCGAVAELHRLPEHPKRLRMCSADSGPSRYQMEQMFMTSIFINAGIPYGQRSAAQAFV